MATLTYLGSNGTLLEVAINILQDVVVGATSLAPLPVFSEGENILSAAKDIDELIDIE